jgi:hypothetical protein
LADIAEVCRRLDGIPLAIELAAARVRMMSVGQIREGLMQRFLLLTGGLRTASPRHQTLRASVDWSYDLLGAKERILLARLSVFAGRFTLDSARVVAAGGDVRDVEILDLLAGLVDRSLIQVAERGSLMRYYLLETIRDYAVEQLAKAGELDTVRDRHAAFFRSLVETAEPHLEGREQDAWADLLEQERPDLRSAVRWAGVRGDGDTAQRLVAALMWFFVIRAHMREGKALFDVALDTPGGSPATRARALQARSYLGWHRLKDETPSRSQTRQRISRAKSVTVGLRLVPSTSLGSSPRRWVASVSISRRASLSHARPAIAGALRTRSAAPEAWAIATARETGARRSCASPSPCARPWGTPRSSTRLDTGLVAACLRQATAQPGRRRSRQ